MLHEIILSLLGFTGDIIVRNKENTTFEVNNKYKHDALGGNGQESYGTVFDLLTEAEQEQVNRIVRLGWYYDSLRAYVRAHEPSFGSPASASATASSSSASGKSRRWNEGSFEVYKAALALGLSDLLEEYVTDVADIESRILEEGALPLSCLLQHMQAYSLALPALHAMLAELETRPCRGAQLLDFLATHQSGATLVNSIVQRMLLRVRVVFLKQTLGWMLHGVLADPAGEYFIVDKQRLSPTSTTSTSTSSAMSAVAPPPPSAPSSFDWTGAYALKLEGVPESHVSPRAAAKIMFAGKAVKLLHVAVNDSKTSGAGAGARGGGPDDLVGDGESNVNFLNYFGGRASKQGNNRVPNANANANASASVSASASSDVGLSSLQTHTTQSSSVLASSDMFDSEAFLLDVLQEHCASNGFSSLSEFYGFAAQFQEILLKPDLAVELLERLIDDVHDLVSLRLWTVVRDKYECFRYLHVMRNTYLVGKGEFFQSLLDEVLVLVLSPVPPDTQHANKLLQHSIIRKVGRRLNLDLDDGGDNSLGFQLQVTSENIIIGSTDFGPLLHLGDIACRGSALVMPFISPGSSSAGIDLAGNRPSRRQFLRLGASAPPPAAELRAADWDRKLTSANGIPVASELPTPPSSSLTSDTLTTSCRCDYNIGSVSLSEERYITKGFSLSTSFMCAWNSVTSLSPSHSIFPPPTSAAVSSAGVLLGAVCCLLHGGGTRRGMQWESATAAAAAAAAASSSHASASRKQTPSSRTFLVQEQLPSMGVLMPDSLAVGVSFHARAVGAPDKRRVEFFARVFVCGDSQEQSSASGTSASASTGGSVGGGSEGTGKHFGIRTGGRGAGSGGVQVLGVCQDDVQLYLCSPQEWRASSVRDVTRRALCAAASLVLEVEYSREVVPAASSSFPSSAVVVTGGAAASKGVLYTLKARLRETGARAAASNMWDINMPITVESSVRVRAGKCALAVVGSGVAISQPPSAAITASPLPRDQAVTFHADITSLEFRSKGNGSAHAPAASPQLSARDPLVYARLDDILSRYKFWTNLKLTYTDTIPGVFCAIFDADALKSYGSMFSFLFKVRMVMFSMERLCLQRRQSVQTGFRPSPSSSSRRRGGSRSAESEEQRRDRVLGHLRHCMLFFLGNLFFYLQVDVIDAEYEILCGEIKSNRHSSHEDTKHEDDSSPPQNFKSVLQAHKNYLATVIRLSMVDNVVVQDAIERVLHACMRVVAISQLLEEEEREGGAQHMQLGESSSSTSTPTAALKQAAYARTSSSSGSMGGTSNSSIPLHEVETLRKDFFTQMSYLLQIMRKVENRGFIFRIDFNGFMSEMSSEIGSGGYPSVQQNR